MGAIVQAVKADGADDVAHWVYEVPAETALRIISAAAQNSDAPADANGNAELLSTVAGNSSYDPPCGGGDKAIADINKQLLLLSKAVQKVSHEANSNPGGARQGRERSHSGGRARGGGGHGGYCTNSQAGSNRSSSSRGGRRSSSRGGHTGQRGAGGGGRGGGPPAPPGSPPLLTPPPPG